MAWFAGVSAIAAVGSAWVAHSNNQVAEGQLAITRLQYTPQLGLNIDQPKLVKDAKHGQFVTAIVRIKNVGSITVYNAHVTAAMAYLPPDQIDQIWSAMNEPDRGVTLAPTEEERLGVSYFAPTEKQWADMRDGNLVLVMVGQIQFTDELGRAHNRYTCGQARPVGDTLIGKFCPTPPQGPVS